MIAEISIENFLSIRDKITLSLDSSTSKRLPQNLIQISNKEKLLKSAVIYGANASGKSNIIKAVFFIWGMVKNSHSFNIDTKIPRIPFKLDKIYLGKPSRFEIIFISHNIKYNYGFSCDNDKIIDEYLFYWPKGRKSKIFERTETKNFDFTIDKKHQKLLASQMNDNTLYLSRATQLGYEKTKKVYEFMVNDIVINYNPFWRDFTIKNIYKNTKLKEKIIEILQKADFGGIENIEVVKDKGKVGGIELKFEKTSPTINILKEKEEDIYNVRFVHKNKEGKLIYFNMSEESGGTNKTLSLLGPIFDILNSGKTVFIDELELHLHPNITKFLVKLFNSRSNKNNAQLIFTTHDTTLLDNELFRKDQLYVCSKEPNKHTKLNSFLDFDLRETADFERAYLNGRVGGLPFIDETLVD